MSKRAVFFDLDGVLLDTLDHAIKSHREVAKTMGLPWPESGIFARSWGFPWREFLDLVWPGVDIEKFSRILHEESVCEREPIPIIPGAKEVLRLLRGKDYFLALITSREKESFLKRCEAAGIDFGSFDFIQVFEDCPFAKPDLRVFEPAIFEAAKREIVENQIIYVGDTLVDFEAARGAGLEFVAVLTGPLGKQDFLNANVSGKNILRSIRDLPEFLKEK